MTPKIIFFALLCIPFLSYSQDLRNDKPFFEREIQTYQRWLDDSGFGDVLQYREMEIKEKELTVYLEFKYEEVDSIVRAWEALKVEFETTHPISLEQQLFYKLTNLFEVRLSAISIAIFDTYDLRKEPLFLRGIYFEDGKVKVEVSNPKSAIRDIYFSPKKVGGKNKTSVEDFKKQFSKEVVFAKVKNYAEVYYNAKTCKNSKPEMRVIEDDEVLRFRVTDLCREVLVDAANPLLARILNKIGYDVNWVKREKLDFTIVYEATSVGFKLHVTLDGKYGSGLYSKVGRGGYYSMDIDFKDYLEDYADEFKTKLKKEILK